MAAYGADVDIELYGFCGIPFKDDTMEGQKISSLVFIFVHAIDKLGLE